MTRTLRMAPPTFFTIPAGTVPSACPSCGETVYLADTLAPGKLAEVDISVMGGRAPTEQHAGSGVLHRIYCTAPARSIAERRKA